MSEPIRNYKSYEYKELTVCEDQAGFYLDSYASFGWELDDHFPPKTTGSNVTFHFKRDRKIANKAELTRLQRNFEADIEQLRALESSKSSSATMWALIIGIVGTFFMAGSVFAVVAEPPQYLLSTLLAIPAFIGWILPCIVYKKIKFRTIQRLNPYIEEKTEELYALCEKGQALL